MNESEMQEILREEKEEINRYYSEKFDRLQEIIDRNQKHIDRNVDEESTTGHFRLGAAQEIMRAMLRDLKSLVEK